MTHGLHPTRHPTTQPTSQTLRLEAPERLSVAVLRMAGRGSGGSRQQDSVRRAPCGFLMSAFVVVSSLTFFARLFFCSSLFSLTGSHSLSLSLVSACCYYQQKNSSKAAALTHRYPRRILHVWAVLFCGRFIKCFYRYLSAIRGWVSLSGHWVFVVCRWKLLFPGDLRNGCVCHCATDGNSADCTRQVLISEKQV